MAQSRASAPGRPGHRHPGRRPRRRGTSSSSAGSTTRSSPPGRPRTLDLGPHEYNSAKAQGVVVVLPEEAGRRPSSARRPRATKQWWSGTGDDLRPRCSRQVTLPAGTATLTFQARWNIEDCGPDACDYAYVEVDDGTGWKAIPGSITKRRRGQRHRRRAATAGCPRRSTCRPTPARRSGCGSATSTDGAAQGTDPDAPSPASSSTRSRSPRAARRCSPTAPRTATTGGRVDGFSLVGASETTMYDNYYIASNRAVRVLRPLPADRAVQLRVPGDRPDWVEHFPYQDGLLVSYWDTSFSDNNESVHPGAGRDPADRLAPAADLPPGRHAVARADPDLRRAVLARRRPTRSRCTSNDGPGQLHPGPGRPAGVRRPPVVLVPGAADASA